MPISEKGPLPHTPSDFFLGRSSVEAQDRIVNGETELLRVAEVGTGRGLVAKKPIEAEKRIFGVEGTKIEALEADESRYQAHMVNDRVATNYNLTRNPDHFLPNAICIGKKQNDDGSISNTWLEPNEDNPLRYINHSCEPNAVRRGKYNVFSARPIQTGEQVTIDYSTLEVNSEWKMECHCGSPKCRGEISSVHFLTPQQVQPLWTFLPDYMQSLYLTYAVEHYTKKNDKRILDKLKR